MTFKDGVKRVFDVGMCLLCWPVVLLVLIIFGLLIKLESSEPIFFRQERLGRNRRRFRVVKLRTMVGDAEKIGAGLYTIKDDPRFTKVGLFLRRFSLDELPQIFNVLAGDMSIVGPRPLPAVIVDQYPEQFEVILRMKPGITGLSQIKGRNELPRSERLKLDMFYVDHWSLSLDLQILLKTIFVVFIGTGQVNYQGREDVER